MVGRSGNKVTFTVQPQQHTPIVVPRSLMCAHCENKLVLLTTDCYHGCRQAAEGIEDLLHTATKG